MGFKKTSEGRVFFKSPDNDDTPLSQALANAEPLVGKDNTQMQILLLLKSLNSKLKSSREDQDSLAQDIEHFKKTLANLEKKGPLTGKTIETKQFDEASKKIQALEKKAVEYETNYIDLEQRVASKQTEVSKKATRVEESVKKTLELVETIKETTTGQDKVVKKLKEDVESQRRIEEALTKKQKALEDTQKDQGEKMVDNVAAYVALTKRIGDTEERHEALDNKIEDGRADYIKLDRKIDKVIEDRNRILRKVERIEQAVIETRDALNAKAMVLLTDQGAVAGVDMPNLGHAAMNTDPMALQKRLEEEALMPWWRKPVRFSAVSLGVVALIILLIGYLISASQYGTARAPENAAVQTPVVKLSEVRPPPERPLFEDNIETARNTMVNAPEPIIEPVMPEGSLDAKEIAAPKAVSVPAKTSEDAYEPDFGINIHKGIDDPSKIRKGVTNIDLNNPKQVEEAFDRDPEMVARELNKIEPSSLPEKDRVLPERMQAKPYQTPAYKAGLRQRIKADPNLVDIAKRIETRAFDGVPEAQHDMGAIYVSGHGSVKQDLRRAVLWFTEASNNGIANATYNLGVLHHRGLGMDKDLPRAMALYEKAADQGHGEAQYNLGIANIEGVGMKYNPQKAAEYFERAAQQGVMEAAYNLGLIHENGLLGQPEPGQALSWYKYAAEQGSPEAKSALNQLASSLNISVEDVNSIVETVRKSDGGNDNTLLSNIQAELMERGFYPGPVDGQMGPVTRSSIRAFQLSAELPINGEPSQALLSLLRDSQY